MIEGNLILLELLKNKQTILSFWKDTWKKLKKKLNRLKNKFNSYKIKLGITDGKSKIRKRKTK